jgi:carbonic anhydrase
MKPNSFQRHNVTRLFRPIFYYSYTMGLQKLPDCLCGVNWIVIMNKTAVLAEGNDILMKYFHVLSGIQTPIKFLQYTLAFDR